MTFSTALRPAGHAGDPRGCRPAGVPRRPAAEPEAWGRRGHRCSHPDTQQGDVRVGALEQHPGVLRNTLGSRREEIAHVGASSP